MRETSGDKSIAIRFALRVLNIDSCSGRNDGARTKNLENCARISRENKSSRNVYGVQSDQVSTIRSMDSLERKFHLLRITETLRLAVPSVIRVVALFRIFSTIRESVGERKGWAILPSTQKFIQSLIHFKISRIFITQYAISLLHPYARGYKLQRSRLSESPNS